MDISIDERGNVSLDYSYSTAGINTVETTMIQILNQMKTFDPAQIEAVNQKLNELYPGMENFNEFLSQWADVLNEVVL